MDGPGAEWKREPLPDFLDHDALQDFIEEIYKARRSNSYIGPGTNELDLGDAAYEYAKSNDYISRKYDGDTVPRPLVGAPRELSNLEIQQKYRDFFEGPFSIESVADEIAESAAVPSDQQLIDFLTPGPNSDGVFGAKPFARGFINYLGCFSEGAKGSLPAKNPLESYYKPHLLRDIIAASLFHHISTTILLNPFFFLDTISWNDEILTEPKNPVDKLYRDLLDYISSPERELVAKTFRSNIIRLLLPRHLHSTRLETLTEQHIVNVTRDRSLQWKHIDLFRTLNGHGSTLANNDSIERLYRLAGKLTVEVASMSRTDIKIKTLHEFDGFPNCMFQLPPRFQFEEAQPRAWMSNWREHYPEMITVPSQHLETRDELSNALKREVRFVMCPLVENMPYRVKDRKFYMDSFMIWPAHVYLEPLELSDESRKKQGGKAGGKEEGGKEEGGKEEGGRQKEDLDEPGKSAFGTSDLSDILARNAKDKGKEEGGKQKSKLTDLKETSVPRPTSSETSKLKELFTNVTESLKQGGEPEEKSAFQKKDGEHFDDLLETKPENRRGKEKSEDKQQKREGDSKSTPTITNPEKAAGDSATAQREKESVQEVEEAVAEKSKETKGSKETAKTAKAGQSSSSEESPSPPKRPHSIFEALNFWRQPWALIVRLSNAAVNYNLFDTISHLWTHPIDSWFVTWWRWASFFFVLGLSVVIFTGWWIGFFPFINLWVAILSDWWTGFSPIIDSSFGTWWQSAFFICVVGLLLFVISLSFMIFAGLFSVVVAGWWTRLSPVIDSLFATSAGWWIGFLSLTSLWVAILSDWWTGLFSVTIAGWWTRFSPFTDSLFATSAGRWTRLSPVIDSLFATSAGWWIGFFSFTSLWVAILSDWWTGFSPVVGSYFVTWWRWASLVFVVGLSSVIFASWRDWTMDFMNLPAAYTSSAFLSTLLYRIFWWGHIEPTVNFVIRRISDVLRIPHITHVVKTLPTRLESLFNLSTTYSWLLEWFLGIGGNTSISIIPDPDAGDYIPSYILGSTLGERLSNSKLGDMLLGSQLAEYIKSSKVPEAAAESSLGEMIAGSKLETVLAELKTGEMLEELKLKNALSGSTLGDILTGSKNEQKLAISNLGEALATSKLADRLLGAEATETLTVPELAKQISETLERDLWATNMRDSVGKDPRFNSKRLETGAEDQLRLSVGKILMELPLRATLKGSKLGYILTISDTEPILLSSAHLRAGHSILVNTPLRTDYATLVSTHAMIEHITPAPVMPNFRAENSAPVITYALPGYGPPVVDPVIPIVTTIGTIFLKILAPIVAFLSEVLSNIKQLLGGVPAYISAYTTPMVGHIVLVLTRIKTAFLEQTTPMASSITPMVGHIVLVLTRIKTVLLEQTAPMASSITSIASRILPASTQIVTLVKESIAQAVAFFSGLRSGHQSLEIPFLSTKLWVLESFILFILSAFGAYWFICQYLFHWSKVIEDAPLPPQENPPPAGSPPLAAIRMALPGASRRSWEWPGTFDGPPPLIRIRKLLTYTHRLLAYLFRPFTYLLRLLNKFGSDHFPRLLNLLPSIDSSMTYIGRPFRYVRWVLADIEDYPLKYVLWVLADIEDYRFPGPPLNRPPLLNRLLIYFFQTCEKLIYVFQTFDIISYSFQISGRIIHLFQTLGKALENISYINNRFFTSRVSSRQYRFPGFAQGQHHHLSHPQWYPLFHMAIGIVIWCFGYYYIPHHPDA